jgi:serine/threonine protein kinase
MGVKICDFGVSRIISKGQIIKEQCGTPAYLAPEIIINKGYSSYFSDLWSLGVVLYTMVCGAVPYRGSSLQELLDAEINKEIEYPSHISPCVKDLIQKLLQFEPVKRITFPEIFKHPWFTGEITSLSDETSVDIRNPNTDKEDVTVFRPGNLFLKKMPRKISAQDYAFIYRDYSESKLGTPII